MAFNRMMPQRLLSMSRMTNPAITNCRTSLPRTAVKSAALSHQTSPTNIAPDPGDDGIFRRYLHRQSAATPSPVRFLPTGEKLLEKLREMDITRDRIRLDGLRRPEAAEESREESMTVMDARKILRLSQLEMVKSKLRQMEKDCVSYPEFLEICAKECLSPELGHEFAKILDESGSVIVLGNVVFLRPEQVVKAIQGLMPLPPRPDDPRMKELEELEKQKAAIDRKAEFYARRELWVGLGYLVVQTAAFMRLTFWELSWDVMEPICFYVTSIYFMGGYAFFLRTSKEPSFEGFFQSRFEAKQKRLFKALRFDVERYEELKKACHPQARETAAAVSFASPTTHRA
ncbi:calcium uniporter protein 2, mitochondrial-like [Salvia miltiorrhiza]|uniref:calcium uniporter protein 2, mitochondrial-like n=1 Tax=Salvia miltiorrhiza TaxID=226208 RepID=UPI0025AC57BF|nr:calcium uniporter protein 2, mitochondrial-like [Salvia miltiorrhiza]